MDNSERNALDKLAPALVKAWGEIGHAVKDANNPHFRNDYATLEAVLNAIKPAFAANGLALLQMPGPMDGEKISVISMVLHASGQHLTVTTQLPIGAKATAQAAGSGYSYARRYAALALGGMAQVDDDGNAASQSTSTRPAVRQTVSVETIKNARTTGELDRLKELVREVDDAALAEAYVARRKELRGK